MSPIKKSDLKKHLSAHNRHGIHLYRPESQPGATDLTKGKSADPDAGESNADGAPLDPPSCTENTIVPAEPDATKVHKVAESKIAQE